AHLHDLCVSLLRRPPTEPTLFPYTTLFRSLRASDIAYRLQHSGAKAVIVYEPFLPAFNETPAVENLVKLVMGGDAQDWQSLDERSEEHTSELQSRFDLVCRLLLEKNKTKDE